MENVWATLVKIAAAVGGAIASFFGGWDSFLIAMIVFMAIDYATGVIVGFMQKSAKTEHGGLDSRVGWKGFFKKVVVLLVIGMATVLDGLAGTDAIIRSAAIFFYIANEGLSILENLSLMGIPMPAVIKNALEQLRAKSEKPPDVDA